MRSTGVDAKLRFDLNCQTNSYYKLQLLQNISQLSKPRLCFALGEGEFRLPHRDGYVCGTFWDRDVGPVPVMSRGLRLLGLSNPSVVAHPTLEAEVAAT